VKPIPEQEQPDWPSILCIQPKAIKDPLDGGLHARKHDHQLGPIGSLVVHGVLVWESVAAHGNDADRATISAP
jgi:hypothetical protein